MAENTEPELIDPKDVIVEYTIIPCLPERLSLAELLERHREWYDEFSDLDNYTDVKLKIHENDERRFDIRRITSINEVWLIIDLTKENLRYARLEEAELPYAHLEGADLSDAHLERAYLYKAHLKEADLSYAHLEGAYLKEAHLQGADLTEAHLEGANFRETHLEGADLSKAHLEGAVLERACLERAILFEAHLERADLRSANLKGAFLYEANLTDAIINEATLKNAKKLRNGGVAMNGIYAKGVNGYDSAALLPVSPGADSKMGRDVNIVIDNLKHSQHLTGVYLTVMGVVLVNVLKIIFEKDLAGLDPKNLPILGPVMMLPFGLLMVLGGLMMIIVMAMVGQGLKKAYEGSKYLQTRDEIAKVGNFAWSLTQYTGLHPHAILPTEPTHDKYPFRNWVWKLKGGNVFFKLKGLFRDVREHWGWYQDKIISYLIRGVMIFSGPVVLAVLMTMQYRFRFDGSGVRFFLCGGVLWYFLTLLLILAVAVWFFLLTERFQKPLVFNAYLDSPEYKKKQEEKEKEAAAKAQEKDAGK